MSRRTAFWVGVLASPVILMGVYISILIVPMIVRAVVPEVVRAVVN
jgi:hypothetical protein